LWRPFAEGQVADVAAVDALIAETRRLRKQIQTKLRDGRDRLLETTQREKVRGDLLAEALQGCDQDIATEDFLVDIFEEIGVQVHEDGPRCYHLEPIRLASGTLPFLPQSGVFVTFDRATALAREDVPFLSLDHPMVEAAMEVFLAEGRGNCACAIWQPTAAGTVAEGVFLELIFVTECVAPAHLHLDRFFPATPLRLVVDHSLELVEPQQLWHAGELSGVKGLPILDRKPFRQRLFPAMLEAARTAAEPKLNAMTRHARQSIHDKVDVEIERLELLEQLNGSAFAGHAAALRDNRDRLLDVLDHAQLRLDAVRLVWRGRA
jgi:ATP-dependent helicase HepA